MPHPTSPHQTAAAQSITPRPFFVADIGSNWDGSRDRALEFIDIAAEAGANAVKYQGFATEAIVSRRGFGELGRVGHQAKWEKDVYTTYESAALPIDWLPDLARRCHEVGVAFMCTAYSPEIVDAVDPFVAMHKAGSGDITWTELLQHLATKRKPIVLGTGAATSEDVRRAFDAIWATDPTADVIPLQCNTNYTGDPRNLRYLNLRVISGWLDNPRLLDVGLSDHTLGYLSVVVAIVLGAGLVEKHLTDDRTRTGPDHAFAMEPQDWRAMVKAVREACATLGDSIKKVEVNERDARIVQRRALRWAIRSEPGCVGPSGITVRPDHIVATRPCPVGALEPYRLDEVIGRVLKRDVEADTLVRLEDLE